jgi:hypothetical protein
MEVDEGKRKKVSSGSTAAHLLNYRGFLGSSRLHLFDLNRQGFLDGCLGYER